MRQNKKEVKKMKISEADLFEKIEAFLADYPICQYGFLKSEDILFRIKCGISAKRSVQGMESPGPARRLWERLRTVKNTAFLISMHWCLRRSRKWKILTIWKRRLQPGRSMKRLSTRSVRNWSSYPKHTLLFLPNPVQSAASVHTLKVAAIRNI